MIKLGYYNDGKNKWQSHEIMIMEDKGFLHFYPLVYSHNPFDISGYGATKEEAIDDFKRKFKYVMNELRAFEAMLFDTDVVTDGIVNIDSLGREIKV